MHQKFVIGDPRSRWRAYRPSAPRSPSCIWEAAKSSR